MLSNHQPPQVAESSLNTTDHTKKFRYFLNTIKIKEGFHFFPLKAKRDVIVGYRRKLQPVC